MELRRGRVCFIFPQSTYIWHGLTILFIISLLVNAVFYFRNNTLHINLGPTAKTAESPTSIYELFVGKEEHVNPHNYSYILNEPSACNASTELVIMVCTSLKNFAEREAVRNTWGSVGKGLHSNITVLFIIGVGGTTELQKQILNESKHYRDIIQEDFIDSYRNLSIKSQAVLKWVNNHCMSSKYVLKADDDMYVNIPNLLTALRSQKDTKFILGCAFVNAKPIQSPKSKWYTPLKDFNEKVYPLYTSGTAYSLSTPSVPDLYEASLKIKLFWLEDIYITGLCARRAKIKRINNYGFHYIKLKVKGCDHKNSITGHRNTPQELYTIYKELKDPNLKCK